MPKFTKPTGRRFQEIKASEKLTNWSHSAMSDNLFKIFLLFWFFPLLIIIFYTVLLFSNLPDQVPLFYSHVWGEQQLANKGYLLLPTVGALLLGIFNFGLAVSFHSKDKILSYLLGGTAALVALLGSITVFNITNLIK